MADSPSCDKDDIDVAKLWSGITSEDIQKLIRDMVLLNVKTPKNVAKVKCISKQSFYNLIQSKHAELVNIYKTIANSSFVLPNTNQPCQDWFPADIKNTLQTNVYIARINGKYYNAEVASEDRKQVNSQIKLEYEHAYDYLWPLVQLYHFSKSPERLDSLVTHVKGKAQTSCEQYYTTSDPKLTLEPFPRTLGELCQALYAIPTKVKMCIGM